MRRSFAALRMTRFSRAWRFRLFLARLLSTNGLQASAVEFEQVCGIIFGLSGGSAALEADSAAGGFAVAGGHGDEFHEVERDIFVAARAERKTGCIHKSKLLKDS